MTLENQLIQKKFYESLIIDQQNEQPLQVLGHMYMEEKDNEHSDLSRIRFSQGEMYYHHKDYETAIFKWAKIHNDLEPWARKNMADAHYELGLLSKSVEFYKSVKTESLALNSEVALQLFSIYTEQEELDMAAAIIKKAISKNPDYPHMTEVARHFFEKHRDWGSAIDLAVNEAIRTEQIEWFNILRDYVDEGLAIPTSPDYFSKVLEVAFNVSKDNFEKLVLSLWNSYEDEELYFSWIDEINRLFSHLEIDTSALWHDVADKYQETYFKLINGQYLIKEIEDMIPTLLTNWMNLEKGTNNLIAATSVLAWNETFVGAVSYTIVEKAEHTLINATENINDIEQIFSLFKEICEWAQSNGLAVDERLKWSIEKVLNEHTNYLLVTGMNGHGKTSFIHSLVGGNVEALPASTVVLYSNAEEIEMTEIIDCSTPSTLSLGDVSEEIQEEVNASQSMFVDYRLPSKFLNEKHLAGRRNAELLFYIRETLSYLVKRRVDTENEMTELIRWKEDIVSKLNAATHQLNDLEKEKTKIIQSSYVKIKDDIKRDLQLQIPKLLKDCSVLINEDTDFRNIHVDLNKEMNERIQDYIQHTILPRFTKAVQGWNQMCNDQFSLSHDFLEEISEGFNMMYGEKRLKLNGDFHVLNDWRRDTNRLSNGIQLETLNILNRSTPSQLAMKSVGKLFETLGSNKALLCKMYKKLIEKEDYEKLVVTVTNQFILQFEWFEKGLGRDVGIFFHDTFSVLQELIKEEQQDIQDKKDRLQQLRANPEQYLDPITLFKIRLQQYEWVQKEFHMSPTNSSTDLKVLETNN